MATPPTPVRTAIVTGAARGIGAGIARRLSADGMAVALLDLDGAGAEREAAAIRDGGGSALGLAADVSDPDSVEAAVAEVVDRLGPVTVLVNNAGIIRDNLIHKMSLEDWDAVMGVHMRGAFLLVKATQGFMVEAGWGRIVNISSASALGNRGQANYSGAKAGLQGFTKALAKELGRFGITVNAIGPGFIETEMTRATAERMGRSFDDIRTWAVESIPVGRSGQPEDIAAAVSFFARDDASFTSGQVLYVAGGPLN
jgi:3-oxoacyl-[acyl-carrier protein] reductase